MVAVPDSFWRAPDYGAVLAARFERLRRIKARPELLPSLRLHYAQHPADFINDWGVTADPRGALLVPPRPVLMPFVLFPRQRECAVWILERAAARSPGLVEKSRDCGLSWLAICLACTLCLFRANLTIGFGSAKEDKIDRSGDPDCLFWKGRTFLQHLPAEFRGGWDLGRHSAHLRLTFPATGSAIVGEAGDNIGRGGRQSITFLDEAAHLERPELIDASLASTTECRIDISSVNGMANSFAQRRHSGRIPVFTFHWRDDPRKDDAWYAKQRELLDPVTLAAEVDLDYRASQEGALIPSAWIQSAIGAHLKLGIKPSGLRVGALDCADQGGDRNAFCGRHGILVEALRSWSGRDRDLFDTACRAFALCDQHGYTSLEYDAIGVGAGIRGDARIINEQRQKAGKTQIYENPFCGSAAVVDPDAEVVEGRTNADFFSNAKSQAWWGLRTRFQAVHRAVADGKQLEDPDLIISLAPDLEELPQLAQELGQVTYSINAAGKVAVDKCPDGARSPNLADSVAIAFNPGTHASWAQTWVRLAG